MNNSTNCKYHQPSKRFVFLLALGVTAGCQSFDARLATRNQTSIQDPTESVDASLHAPVSANNCEIAQVGFNELATPSTSQLVWASPLEIDGTEGVIDTAHGTSLADAASFRSMTLNDFEAIAFANNPTIQQLEATTRKAAGFRTQVGLRPNPVVGYQAMQLADAGTDQHVAFLSQTFVTADKLELNRRVLNEALRAQLFQLEAQKYRISTDIRVKFYDALAAQRRMRLIEDFQSVADRGLEIAEELKSAKEGSQLEVVQAKVQKNEVDLALRNASISFEAAWRELVALTGSPEMLPVSLDGELPQAETSLDWSSVASSIVSSSPEYQAAQARVSQARANITRQNVQAVPNIDLQFGAGVDNATDSGMINLQVSAPIPVFNKNQGNMSAARAELNRACMEVRRIENSIKARLAEVSQAYDSSLASVSMYAEEILPNAAEGLKLAETAYKSGETSFLQVLVARRTYFDTNLQYIVAQAQLAQARARVDGYVLTGALDPIIDNSGDDTLRGLTLSQQ